VTQPIKNFRINQSVLAAFDAADAVGNVSEATFVSVFARAGDPHARLPSRQRE